DWYTFDMTADGKYAVFRERLDVPRDSGNVTNAVFARNLQTGALTQISDGFGPNGQWQLPTFAVAADMDKVVWAGWRDDPTLGWSFGVWIADLATGNQVALPFNSGVQPCDAGTCE